MSQSLVSNFVIKPATILNGAALSNEIDCLGLILVGIVFPASWTAAHVTFQGSVDGSKDTYLAGANAPDGGPTFTKQTASGATFQELTDEAGAAIDWAGAVAAKTVINTPTKPFPQGFNHLIVRSGTLGVPVNQGGDRILKLIFAVPNA